MLCICNPFWSQKRNPAILPQHRTQRPWASHFNPRQSKAGKIPKDTNAPEPSSIHPLHQLSWTERGRFCIHNPLFTLGKIIYKLSVQHTKHHETNIMILINHPNIGTLTQYSHPPHFPDALRPLSGGKKAGRFWQLEDHQKHIKQLTTVLISAQN